MTKRIFNAMCMTILILFSSFFAITIAVFYSYTFGIYKKNLNTYADTVVRYYENKGSDGIDDLLSPEYRISLIENTGKLLYDTANINVEEAENHLNREEIKEALEYGRGVSKRYSSTLTKVSLYNARKLADGNIIRVSITSESVISIIFEFLRILLVFTIIILIIAMFLASRLSKMIVEPLNNLDIDNPLDNKELDELSSLFLRLESNKKKIRIQEKELERKQKELSTIISSISEGMVILNTNFEIININEGALKFLHISEDCIGKKLIGFIRNIKLHESILSAGEGERREQILSLNDGVYKINTYPLKSGAEIQAIAVLIFNVTGKEEIETIRKEFTANVSHELKTPLQSISGYAELLKNNMVAKEDIQTFASKIHSEVSRMKVLIDDIIKLSKLDEESKEFVWEDVDLYELTKSVAETLKDKAADFNISINIEGETAVIRAVPELCGLIVYNLVDNAIKYNKPGGFVDIKLNKTEAGVCLSVKDNGIGIDRAEHDRIFERFYRVDKSRSKQSGGTGLGLSIVKNAIKVHKGKIELVSEPGVGTEIIIKFNQE